MITEGTFYYLNHKFGFVAHYQLSKDDILIEKIAVGLKDVPGLSDPFIDLTSQALPELHNEAKDAAIAKIQSETN